jgi:hypothetical protein
MDHGERRDDGRLLEVLKGVRQRVTEAREERHDRLPGRA